MDTPRATRKLRQKSNVISVRFAKKCWRKKLSVPTRTVLTVRPTKSLKSEAGIRFLQESRARLVFGRALFHTHKFWEARDEDCGFMPLRSIGGMARPSGASGDSDPLRRAPHK